MNIGLVTTWLERGATYVTKTYMHLLKNDNQLFVFARGGEYFDKNLHFEKAQIEKGYRLYGTKIYWKQFKRWIIKNKLDVILFNEQDEMECVYLTKLHFPDVRIGCYIDYYKENTLQSFQVYDFLLCNTVRHFEAFKWHKNAFYIPWGTDIETFKCSIDCRDNDGVVFFHSAGMSNRKGTQTLVSAFINGQFVRHNAKLIIHTQKPLDSTISKLIAGNDNIQVIQKTVPHPGLYHLGDVYVYPTTLDGLGLTIYEALASGLPVITTNADPMREIVNPQNNNGRLVDVIRVCSRSDGYYWPLTYVSEASLINEMLHYVQNRQHLSEYKESALRFAQENLNIVERKEMVQEIICGYCKNDMDETTLRKTLQFNKIAEKNNFYHSVIEYILSPFIKNFIRNRREMKRYDNA